MQNNATASGGLQLKLITNRGVKVWPAGRDEAFCTDHWRCRFRSDDAASNKDILALLTALDHHNLDAVKTENLHEFNNEAAYSMGQGQ